MYMMHMGPWDPNPEDKMLRPKDEQGKQEPYYWNDGYLEHQLECESPLSTKSETQGSKKPKQF